MPFSVSWFDEEQTVQQLSAEGDWNWRDYHRTAHVAAVNLMNHPQPVDRVVDFRGGTRDRFPGGGAAHARSFTKKTSPKLTGRVIVIGMPDAVQASLTTTGELATDDGLLVFADSEDAARQIIQRWRNES